MNFISFITNCFIVLKLRNTNRYNCLNKFNFTKITSFTIQLFKVSREGILFYASVTTNGSNLEENMDIAKSLNLLL